VGPVSKHVSCGHGEVKEGREGMNMYLRSLQGGLCRAVSSCFPFGFVRYSRFVDVVVIETKNKSGLGRRRGFQRGHTRSM
jgi:hypothetical protein